MFPEDVTETFKLHHTQDKLIVLTKQPEWQPAAALRSSGSNAQPSLNSMPALTSLVSLDFAELLLPSIIPDDPQDSKLLTQPFVTTFDPFLPCDKKLLSFCKSLTGFLGKLHDLTACFKARRERGHGDAYTGVA